MRIKRACAQALMNAVAAQLTIELGQAPTVINAPPSQKGQYPAIALLVDDAELDISNDDEDVQVDPAKQLGDVGFELTGFFRTDPVTNDYVVGTTYRIDQDTTVSQIGVIRMRCRLWVGARLDTMREQLEQEVILAFCENRGAPTRLQVSIAGVEVRGVKIPFGIATALLDDRIQWNSEYAFAERLWTYIPLTIDAPVMVPRTDPIVEQLILVVSQDLDTTVETPADLDNLTNRIELMVDSSGDVSQV